MFGERPGGAKKEAAGKADGERGGASKGRVGGGCVTAKNSTTATRTNSPGKGSLASSQLVLPAPALVKHYKFYYQIGFGAFGRVWKVAERESGVEYALKEISKHKYFGIDLES